MIHIENVIKRFGAVTAVNDVSLEIDDRQVFGLVGTNGAGKSTLLRLVSGILRPDSGRIEVLGEPVPGRPEIREDLFFIPDDPYFFRNGTAADMRNFYRTVYPRFDAGRFDRLLADFSLDPRRRISHYSRGMKKQLAVLCGICSGARYLLCDETFDGLDPVMRQAVKSIFANDMSERGLTPVIASHNLRELEDICDHVGIMRRGKMLLEKSLADMQGSTVKLQMVGPAPKGLEVLHSSTVGRLSTYIVRGTLPRVQAAAEREKPPYFDVLPLSLEEIFIYELGGMAHEAEGLLL